MISFNRGYSPDDENEKLAKKLQKMLDKALEEEIDDIVDISIESLQDDDDDLIELSTLIDLVYEKLFVENNKKITITIDKNPNNSLNLTVNDLQ
tara:strand:+ start:1551 stop:1832 length:282 start_codon:yes stop_codon:yes gene_type:complete